MPFRPNGMICAPAGMSTCERREWKKTKKRRGFAGANPGYAAAIRDDLGFAFTSSVFHRITGGISSAGGCVAGRLLLERLRRDPVIDFFLGFFFRDAIALLDFA